MTMNLIKLELVDYDYRLKPIPMKDETYINEAFLLGVSKNAMELAKDVYEFTYTIHLAGHEDVSISEECFNRIIGRETDLPEGPEIYSGKERPKKPENSPNLRLNKFF